MRHLLSQTVNPVLGLKNSIEHWPEISMSLRERSRKRCNQVAGFLNASYLQSRKKQKNRENYRQS